ncbi:ATP-binding cassette sub-family G member 1 [Thelohanellus kitauei]|uniref:ATP-binding cassette sub-family G member 1 n=1 Tax=Thelohanellus kitauei TaxID=669202 RepID=A0A0C2J9B6_THEKT|nr:ATP-binding cassette sub-family G member 1 [Thelohanellus kitauei]
MRENDYHKLHNVAEDNATTLNIDHESLLLFTPNMTVKIDFKSIVYKVQVNKKKKAILNEVTGTIFPGELTAIIGPSGCGFYNPGAGKTTLLDVLAGYKRSISSGVILVNDYIRNEEEFRKCCAYIMQEDAMLPNLTVLESMMVSANLRFDPTFESHSEKKERVNEILQHLGLEDVASSYICDLSGGQRKRTSIALELVSNPPVIFLDEPTRFVIDSLVVLIAIQRFSV